MSIVKTVLGRLTIALGAVLVTCASSAQTYPQRPIKAIVPYAAGGFSDQVSRILAEAMSRNLGQNIIIENRAGGGGGLGSGNISKTKPRGFPMRLYTNGNYNSMTGV